MWKLSEQDDTIDSRDISERIEQLEDDNDRDDVDQRVELDTLVTFREDFNSFSWKNGILFIKDSFFEEYARNFAEESHRLDCSIGWPFHWIDWKAAANELQSFYYPVKLDGVDYWYRRRK